MTTPFKVLQIARVTVEARTPLSLASGSYDARFDTLLVRDANDLPALPGTSIAGVLRRVFESRFGAERTTSLFGLPGGTSDSVADGFEASRLWVSWAHVHAADNQPIETFRLEGVGSDPILNLLQMDQPLQRDNVRIDGDTGAVDGRGKFSRAAVPRGTRFTFEVSLASDVSVNPDWSDLLSVIANGFRIGGATRRGLGRVCVKTVSSQTFELDKDDQYQAYCNYQRDPAAVAAASKDISSTIARSPTGAHILELQVKAVDYVRIGQSKEPLALGHAARPPHQIPRHETVIVWSKSQGATLQELRVVVPGSSIKGALRHRVQFHLNCLNGSFADHAPADRMPDEPSLKSVFGFVADRSRGENGKAQAGIISIDDVFLDKDPIIGLMMHNSLDRFSQGTRDGVLFSEELLFETPLSLCIEISAAAQIDPKVREALRLALDDFSEGRLAIGGGAAKGHGYFKKNVALRDHTKSRSWTQFFGGCS